MEAIHMNTHSIITRNQIALTIAFVVALLPAVAFAHGGFEHVMGTVSKISDTSVTVTTAAGKSVDVALDAKTTYARATQALQRADLKVGDRVVIDAVKTGDKLAAHSIKIGGATAAKAVQHEHADAH
jgi:hypothetical protein